MISNPLLPAYRYDPYSKAFTIEKYDHDEMKKIRGEEVEKAKSGRKWGIILGSLGRQGSPNILRVPHTHTHTHTHTQTQTQTQTHTQTQTQTHTQTHTHTHTHRTHHILTVQL
jgi:diphthamide synthase subunit DPH2